MEPRGTILVVDDTADTADLLRGVLAQAGYRVLVARTAHVGLQILGAFRVELVFTSPPPSTDNEAGDVWAGLDRLVHAAGATPLVLYTADESGRYAEHATHGFAARLATPLDLQALQALIDTLLVVDGQRPSVAPQPATARER